MELTKRTKKYLFLNIGLISAIIVTYAVYSVALKDRLKMLNACIAPAHISKDDSTAPTTPEITKCKATQEYKNLHAKCKTFGWISVILLVIFCIVNWRTAAIIVMFILTASGSGGAPDFSNASSRLLGTSSRENRGGQANNYRV